MKAYIAALVLVTAVSSQAIVLHQHDDEIRTQGEKVYHETKERIEVPDAELEGIPKFIMGKDPVPLSMADVVRIADEHFYKTLQIRFTEQKGVLRGI